MVEIIADISGNHGGDLDKALELIYWANWAGCSCVKFQYYQAEDMPWTGQSDFDMYRKLAVRDRWLPRLFDCAKSVGIPLFASVFTLRAVREILSFGVPYIKLASPKSTQLSEEVYCDIILEVPPTVDIIASGPGWPSCISRILYCPDGHPPVITPQSFEEFRRWNYYGFSDHTPGIQVPMAFIRAGAKMIEKHIKLAKDEECVDHTFSADPMTMETLCKWTRRQ